MHSSYLTSGTVSDYSYTVSLSDLDTLRQFLHDPEIYDDPMNFVPERWLVNSPPPHPREIIFGFGRRFVPLRLVSEYPHV